jgi:hypothetical protein
MRITVSIFWNKLRKTTWCHLPSTDQGALWWEPHEIGIRFQPRKFSEWGSAVSRNVGMILLRSDASNPSGTSWRNSTVSMEMVLLHTHFLKPEFLPIIIYFVGSRVLIAIIIESAAFCRLNLLLSYLSCFSALKMEALFSSEISRFFRTIRCYSQEQRTHHSHYSENLKFKKIKMSLSMFMLRKIQYQIT